MHDPEKSDSGIVAGKPTNKAGRPVAELVEPRPGTKGNAEQQHMHRTQSRARMSQALDRVRQAARLRKKERFTALFHHINVDTLRTAFYTLKRKAAPGVDGMTWQDYEADLEPRLRDLHERVHRGTYRPQPSRRTYIPKADGKQRPLAIAALEDKIVQGTTVMVLNAIYEGDFCGFSYGFRPGRGPHDALDALYVAIDRRKVNWIVDADIQNFFGAVSQEWLVRFVEHRIGDKRIIRLIRKWLKAGILEDGIVTVEDRGTGQGSVISPLLANIYLHYVFDLWAQRWRQREATGGMIIVRYADDVVVGFEREEDARHFLDAMRARLEEFALSLHPDKTRLIEFGRFAAVDRKKRGLGKPETFAFLGFTFICGKSRKGRFQLRRKTRSDRMRAKLKDIKAELRRRMHRPIPEQGKWLRQVVTGYFGYYAVPTNGRALSAFRHHVTDLWRRTLRRRSQRDGFTWARMTKLTDDWLPKPRILHPWPNERFAVSHPR
ncbi:group II intron reverse transcriptase/maturase [Rhizobium jaguaris]|uniref:Group II intron reverse transcriptase/maturase n=2 Tax=Rhizobium jaguaris TaxID=1312183 RepID=A0A387FZP9_9HYPH|nr:group II intron reverse transcriptase/maturase [Rhizobium jaguaris]AYG60686.1 group II intron reverse transcriptase/maturase [Rhizobium jaguaris]AYG62390.1 group II intron reverse transcriptase/maturase [Rhizobium jaguaris]